MADDDRIRRIAAERNGTLVPLRFFGEYGELLVSRRSQHDLPSSSALDLRCFHADDVVRSVRRFHDCWLLYTTRKVSRDAAEREFLRLRLDGDFAYQPHDCTTSELAAWVLQQCSVVDRVLATRLALVPKTTEQSDGDR